MRVLVGCKSGNLVKLERTGKKALPRDPSAYIYLYAVELEDDDGKIRRIDNLEVDEIHFTRAVFTFID